MLASMPVGTGGGSPRRVRRLSAPILDLLAALVRDRGDLALVLITHDPATAALAHRIAVLDAGEVVEQGPAGRVLTEPRHPFTVALRETIDRLGTYTRA